MTRRTTILLLDNADSFTFTLADYLISLDADVVVRRSDAVSVEEALAVGRSGIVISPGPGGPAEAGCSVDLATECVKRLRPLLGICLGHQALALACGSIVERLPPVHGKVANIRHDGSGLFASLASPFVATRYHSLGVRLLHSPLVANAWSEEGMIMAVRHETAPAHGLQFHPESIASENGHALLGAFLGVCRQGA